MAKRQLNIYFQDIVESIELIEQFVSGISLKEFEANIEKQDAVIRRLTIIGEAAKHVPTISEPISQKFRGERLPGFVILSSMSILVFHWKLYGE